jgi:heptosyltransferase II
VKILVVGPSWIGDTVLAQPLLSLLHERDPALTVDVLSPDWALPVVRRMPEVRRAIASPFAHGELQFSERRRLGLSLRTERYDRAVVLPNTFKSTLVPWFARIPRRTGYRGEMRWGLLNDVRAPEAGLPQIAQRYAALGLEPGETLPSSLTNPHLTIDEKQRRATLEALGLTSPLEPIALCPGAEYGPAKRWPPAYFAELARAFAGAGHAVWLLGSVRDRDIGEDIVRLSEGACANLCGRTTLDQAADLLASAKLVITNDSGLMHVAAAVGARVIAIYGSSTPEFTPPLSPRATIAKLDIPCSPCFERTCPLGHFNCMMQLKPAQIRTRAVALLGEPGRMKA